MAVPQHQALLGTGLLEVVQLCLRDDQQHSLLIICSSRHDLEEALQGLTRQTDATLSAEERFEGGHQTTNVRRWFKAVPSLRDLAGWQSMHLVFCYDLARLRAYLLKLSLVTEQNGSLPMPSSYARLILVNMVHAHKSTSSWSAQGINRTLAAVIDTATVLGSQLLLVEDSTLPRSQAVADQLASSPVHDPDGVDSHMVGPTRPIWDAQVGIIDTHTRVYGNDTQAWTGRTVKVRDVLQRWMAIEGDLNMQPQADVH